MQPHCGVLSRLFECSGPFNFGSSYRLYVHSILVLLLSTPRIRAFLSMGSITFKNIIGAFSGFPPYLSDSIVQVIVFLFRCDMEITRNLAKWRLFGVSATPFISMILDIHAMLKTMSWAMPWGIARSLENMTGNGTPGNSRTRTCDRYFGPFRFKEGPIARH